MRFHLIEKESRHVIDECVSRTLRQAVGILFSRNPRSYRTGMVVDDVNLDEALATRHYPSLKSFGA